MSFYGESFSYNGRSCEEFGLMLYEIDGFQQGNSKFATQELQEERIAGSMKTLFYDSWYKEPLEFTLIFGAGEYEANEREPIDRYEMQRVAAWLTDQREYGWLTIDQPDLEGIRYRCIMTGLEMVELHGDKWAFKCTAHCDSPYAYLLPRAYAYIVSGEQTVNIRSRSSANDAYYPIIHIKINSGDSFSWTNNREMERPFTLTNLPQGLGEITIDGERGLIMAESGVNLYQYCNFQFPRLLRGDNAITIAGNVQISIVCEYPVNVGG